SSHGNRSSHRSPDYELRHSDGTAKPRRFTKSTKKSLYKSIFLRDLRLSSCLRGSVRAGGREDGGGRRLHGGAGGTRRGRVRDVVRRLPSRRSRRRHWAGAEGAAL